MIDHLKIFAGIDVGAARTKVALLDADQRVLGRSVAKSGTDFTATARRCLLEALSRAKRTADDIGTTVATGYGRKNVENARDVKTEISCHAKGCFHYFPMNITIIDIGGQDNKVIKLDDRGHLLNFKMNRKCAAGTGAFLEEMSLRLDIPIEDMDGLARKSTQTVELGSYCTVFTATEVLEKIRQGEKVPDIVRGLFASVIKRIMEMDPLSGHVVMTGGVAAHNPFMITMMEAMLGRPVQVPAYPQFTGAVGAALYAMGA